MRSSFCGHISLRSSSHEVVLFETDIDNISYLTDVYNNRSEMSYISIYEKSIEK